MLRGEVKSRDGKQVILATYSKRITLIRVGQHCMKAHRSYIPLADGSENKDDRDGDRCNADDAKDGTDGKDASQKEPKRRYGPRKPKAAMSKRSHADSVENQDTRAKKAKGKAAPAKKSRPV